MRECWINVYEDYWIGPWASSRAIAIASKSKVYKVIYRIHVRLK